MILLSHIWGIQGVLSAGPVADGLAFVLALVFLIKEMKLLDKANVKEDNHLDETNINPNKDDKKIVITIAREYGSGGRYIGKLVAEKLGIKLYDKEFIEELSDKTGLTDEYIEANEQKRNLLDNFNNAYYGGLNNSCLLYTSPSPRD